MEGFKHETLDMIDSISKELNDLQEKLYKLSVQAQLLEVDIATQFSPDNVLEIKRLDQKYLESNKAVADMTKQTQRLFDDTDVTIHDVNVKTCTSKKENYFSCNN